MENVKILFISHERELNGATKSLINLISQFEKRNKIYVLTAYNDGPFCEELKKHKVQMLVYPYFWWCVSKNTSRFSILNPMLWLTSAPMETEGGTHQRENSRCFSGAYSKRADSDCPYKYQCHQYRRITEKTAWKRY